MFNISNPPLQVRHADLERCGDSVYKSVCPVDGCDGTLLMRRDPLTALLREGDYCMMCGQQVIYTDIDRVRQEHG